MEAAQVYAIKAQTMEVVVPSMQELMRLVLDQLLESVLETAVGVVAAAADTAADTVHPGTKCYYSAVGTIEMDHNETVRKSGVVL